METRKLQQVGGGTFTVSIPKEWAVEHDLEAGAEVHLYTHTDGSVVVRSAERDGGHLDAVRVDLDGDATTPTDATRPLRAAQTAGFRRVTLVHADAFTVDQRRAVRSLVDDLVGAELVVEREDELRVRNVLDADEVSVSQTVRQLQYVALAAHRSATDALLDAADDATDRLAGRERESDRLVRMVARHCHRSLTSFETVDRLGVDRPTLFDYHETARQLRGVVADAARLARLAERTSTRPVDGAADVVADAAETARGIVHDAASATFDGTGRGSALDVPDETGRASAGESADGAAVERVHAVLDRRDDFETDLDAVETALFAEPTPAENAASDGPGDADRADALVLARALGPLARTADRGDRMARVALEAAVREGVVTGSRDDAPSTRR